MFCSHRHSNHALPQDALNFSVSILHGQLQRCGTRKVPALLGTEELRRGVRPFANETLAKKHVFVCLGNLSINHFLGNTIYGSRK